MNKKIIFSILMAIFFIGLFVGILEKQFIWWNVLLGLPVMFFVSLNLATQINEQRSPAWIFIISGVFLLFLYVMIKINTLGIYVSSIIGLLVGFMLYYGWILPHKPFSREGYIKNQYKKDRG